MLRCAADADAVHHARVCVRRLRSDVRTFQPLLDAGWAGELRERLRWPQDVLSAARDADVVLEHLRCARRALPECDQPTFDEVAGAPARRAGAGVRRRARDVRRSALRAHVARDGRRRRTPAAQRARRRADRRCDRSDAERGLGDAAPPDSQAFAPAVGPRAARDPHRRQTRALRRRGDRARRRPAAPGVWGATRSGCRRCSASSTTPSSPASGCARWAPPGMRRSSRASSAAVANDAERDARRRWRKAWRAVKRSYRRLRRNW